MDILKNAIKSFFSLFAICRLFDIQTTNPLTIILFLVFLYVYSRFSLAEVQCKLDTSDYIHSGILSFLFTGFTFAYTCYDMVTGLENNLFCAIVWIFCILGLIFIYFHTAQWIMITVSPIRLDVTLYPNKLLPYIAFIACIVCWLPSFLYEYPGVMTPDGLSQYAQAVGIYELSNHHSIIYTYLIRLFNTIGTALFNDVHAGIACFTVAQMIFMAFVAGYVVRTLQKARLHNAVCIVTILFYALMPYIGMFSVNILKDTLFAGNMSLFAASMLRLLIKSERISITKSEIFCEVIPYIISAFMICLLRGNCWYAFLVSLPFILVAFREKLKLIIPVNVIILVLVLFIKYPYMTIYEIQQPDFVESISIPVQQISRVIVAGQELTPEQYEKLSNYIDISQISNEYQSDVSDNIKNLIRRTGNEYLEEHKMDFLLLWLEIGLDHPQAYFDAYVDQTHGYWYPDVYCEVGLADGIFDNDMGISWNPVIKGNAVVKFREILFKLQTLIPLYGLLWSMGFVFWMLLIVIALCFRNYKADNIVVALPVLFMILTLFIATPVAWEFRYAYALFFGLPIYIMLPFINKE